MKKCIFLLMNLLQVYASILPIPDYETHLKKGCPEPDYNKDCDCSNDFPFDNTCKDGLICCDDNWCGRSSCQIPKRKCPNPWYPDGCSTPTSITTTPSPIIDTCDPNDPESCIPGKRCCFDGCSYNCEWVISDMLCLDSMPFCNVITYLCDPNIVDDCPIGYNCCIEACIFDCFSILGLCPIINNPCPTIPPTSTELPYETCFIYNGGDDCPEGEICCDDGCGYSCIAPELECDYFDCSYVECFDPYTGEDTCPDGLYCCYDGCENMCTEPVYYRVSCPNDSIIEHEDVWTKFCLNDCNCPDYQLCCDSPCDCDLNICRDFVVQPASCPDNCNYDYYDYYEYYGGNYCSSDDQCLGLNQLCCDCSWYINNYRQCVDPVYGTPESSEYIPIPLGK